MASRWCIIGMLLLGMASAERYHARDGHLLSGSVQSEDEPLSLIQDGDRVLFSVIAQQDAPHDVDIFHRTEGRSILEVAANGYEPKIVKLESGQETTRISVALRRGVNTLIVSKKNGQTCQLASLDINGTVLPSQGATVDYIEYEAEDNAYNGNLIGPDRYYTHLPSEASQRKAVQLNGDNQQVTFTLQSAANAISVRFSIPNSADGSGLTGTLGVWTNNAFIVNLTCTSKYSWTYGGYPFDRNPSGGSPHHFYDEVRSVLPHQLSAGTRVSLVPLTPGMTFTIDLADFYNAPQPYGRPNPSVSVTDFGADPSGHSDSTGAINNAMNSAKQKNVPLWFPEGTFLVSSRFTVNQVTIRGAGPWYTTLTTNNPGQVGFFGNWAPNPSTGVQVYDLSILGVTQERHDDQVDSGFGGSLSNSVIQNVHISHTKCGMWLDGPFNGLSITGVTIRDTWADGINLHDGITNTIIENSDLRNTGDDGLAMWSQNNADANNVLRFNTIRLPVLANGIAIYGGHDNSATDNIISDTICEGGGLQASNRFGSVALAGTTSFARNTLYRCGAPNRYNSDHNGAIWVWAQENTMDSPVTFENHQVYDSSFSGITFWGSEASATSFNQMTIQQAPYAIEVRSLSGRAYFQNVVASQLTMAGVQTCDPGFTLVNQGGNSGWNTQRCN